MLIKILGKKQKHKKQFKIKKKLKKKRITNIEVIKTQLSDLCFVLKRKLSTMLVGKIAIVTILSSRQFYSFYVIFQFNGYR